jgi:hypothetical protein
MQNKYKDIRLNILAVFIAAVFLYSFNNINKGELKIIIKYCRNSTELAYLSELVLIKNGKEYKELKPEYENEQTISDLDTGSYTISYKTIFNKTEQINITISEYKKYEVDLCIDYMDYSKENYKPIIDQLKDKESYKIIIASKGCFHSTKDSIIINREDKTYAILFGHKSKTLTKSDIESIRHFELELNYMKLGGCTTEDTYVIKYNNKTTTFIDGRCRWNGAFYLIRNIFGDK